MIYDMKQIKFHTISIFLFAILVLWIFSASSLTVVLAQEPSASPTPQESSTGIFITVLSDEPFANVRLGPSASIYPVIGQLFPGDTAPALGRSPGGDWIQIEFPGGPNNRGWVYSPLVRLSPGTLQIMEPPPTPVPPATATFDSTLAAQFVIVPTGTRLPTFTPAPPVTVPAYETPATGSDADSVPRALVILSLGGFGLFGFIASLFLYRR
jgi:hypothetical protein